MSERLFRRVDSDHTRIPAVRPPANNCLSSTPSAKRSQFLKKCVLFFFLIRPEQVARVPFLATDMYILPK